MNIPAEGTRAGDIFAIMVFVAPIVSVALSSFVRPKGWAFFLALIGSGSVIASGIYLAGGNAPIADMKHSNLIFGGWAGLVSFFLACAVTFGRVFIKGPEVEPKAAVD